MKALRHLTAAICLLAPTAAPAQETSLEAARRGVEARRLAVIAAYKRGDAAAAAATVAPDAVIVEPDGTRTEGRERIGANYARILANYHFDQLEITNTIFGAAGDIAYVMGTQRATFRSKTGGKTMTSTVQHLAVLARQPDGHWLLRYLVEAPMPPTGAQR